ncbi:putative nuclease HARBI1 [Temnothorax longispinosus]|uniref:putative nuclease HARBI1 n=1 Tax=Temnothorax longispinosus TaxID=300112 RepID=UPI003A9A4B62
MEYICAINEIREVRNVVQIGERMPQVFRHRIDPFERFNDIQFRNRYRLSKEAVRFVIGLVEERLSSQAGHEKDVSSALQVLIALRFYAKGCYQTELGDLHGVSQPTVSRIVAKVSKAIAAHLPHFVHFPDIMEALQMEFYNIAGFSQVIGCIDCTHIRIKCPDQERAMLYINRKGFYSINVQVVCDAQRRILDIVARWRGSAHDSRIWNSSRLKEEFEERRMTGILLGDAGYPCRPYLLTPFLQPQTDTQNRYNWAHIRTRLTVERCFGEWKGMFRALQNNMQINLETAKVAIIAMAILFNIRKQFNNFEYEIDDEENQSDEEQRAVVPHATERPGAAFRLDFAQRHFG